MSVSIPISYGELLDKITILEIKRERITDSEKVANVGVELEALIEAWSACDIDHAAVSTLRDKLRKINETLWVIEDDIRYFESTQNFGQEFIELARRVYQTNDERAQIKRQINTCLGSKLIEEKSYQTY